MFATACCELQEITNMQHRAKQPMWAVLGTLFVLVFPIRSLGQG